MSRSGRALLPALLLLATLDAGEPSPKLTGFTKTGASAQAGLEARFDSLLRAEDQKAWLEQMASEPNHVGSPHNLANAEFMLAKFKEWGWEAQIERFEVLYPTPQETRVELVAPSRFVAKMREPAVPGDRTSTQTEAQLPPYHVFGADGDVTAELVYVNQGMPDDYKELAANGIDVKGRIVIARYGGGWRGLKPKFAHEHGAIGCLVYSDPRDDGYGAGDPYPKGGFRPADGVQRGSVMDMPLYPGDPLTPGVAATPGAKRLPIAEASTILKIPVLPISYANAQPLLAALEGPVVPESMRGALPLTYHFGPGPATVHLRVRSEWSLKTICNVVARMSGRDFPEQWILRGNHHDAWVFGAEDPLSANVALMAEAKALGELARQGWRPRRSLVYCSWDAEEPGLIGSTEWVEAHEAELRQKAVLYINSDGHGRGFLHANGSHSLQQLVDEVAASVRDPETKATVLERQRAQILVESSKPGASEDLKRAALRVRDGNGVRPLKALGSGSDYTAFLDHAGIAALDISFDGESDTDGVYHSAYDSMDHYQRFGDPGFAYGVALAQTAGRLVLRVSEADVLPFVTANFAATVDHYTTDLHRLTGDLRESTELQHRLLDEHLYGLAADPTKTFREPERDAAVPFLNFAPLDNAVARLKRSTEACDKAVAEAMQAGRKLDPATLAELNARLRTLEQSLLDPEGLPQRPWFRHLIYAPGLKTGYAVKTLPAIREAIEDRRWQDVEAACGRTAKVLNAYSQETEKITTLLKPKEAPPALAKAGSRQ